MNDIQFEVITDLAVLNPQHIETNFEAVDAYLTEAMEPYTQMVVTEDSIGDAKKTLAQLRKLKDGINAQKIAVKREWMKPYTEYEDKAKQLMSRVEAGISNIDGQVKDYDSRRKEQKMAELKDYFDQEASRYRVEEYLDWNLIRNPKWANASFSVEDAENEISGIITRTAGDVDYITGTESVFTAAMLIEYRRSRDLRAALSVEDRLKAVQEAEERKKAERVAETFREEETQTTAPEVPAEPEQQQFIRPLTEDEPPKPKLYDLAFKVKVTMQQAHALKAFFSEQGIEYHKI
ncbi:MAG: DUF1351 domain-containing protein [bacterium]